MRSNRSLPRRTSLNRTRTARRLVFEGLEDRRVLSLMPPAGLVSWWTGDNNARDMVRPNDGALIGGAGYGSGEVGQAFSFDGSDALFQAPTAGIPTGGHDRTLELWVKANSFPNSGESFIAGYGAFGNLGQAFALGMSGNRIFFSQWGKTLDGPELSANQWHHVAVTYYSAYLANLYVDGVWVGQRSIDVDTPADTQFYMGRIAGSLGDSRKLNGLVDEVSVYDRALGPDEIQSIYQAGSSGKFRVVTWSPARLPAGTPNVPYSRTITARGGTGTLTLAVSNVHGAVPGLDVPASGTGSLAITGTPTAPGTETFTVTSTDSVGVTASADYMLLSYTMTDLGTLGGTQTAARAINFSGQVVGWSATASGLEHAFLYSNGAMTDLGTLPGDEYSFATAINASGQVVGVSGTSYGYQHAFLYSNGNMTNLGNVGAYYDTIQINDSGQVLAVGNSDGIWQSFLYSNGAKIDLGTLGLVVHPAAINSSGQVAGTYQTTSGGPQRAFLYSNGTMTDLGTLGTWSTATALNDSGQVAGNTDTASGNVRAFLYSNGSMTDLGSFFGGGTGNSFAYAINANGQVVGYAESPGLLGTTEAFLYSNGAMTDLGTPLTNLDTTLAINASGEVVGSYTPFGGNETAFLYSNGARIDLDTLPGIYAIGAVAINDNGQVIGGATPEVGGGGRAFLLTTSTAGATDPALTVNPLTTTNPQPTLTGTVSDSAPGAVIVGVTVVVNGQTVSTAVAGGVWSAAVAQPLALGSYDVRVSATDSLGNSNSVTARGALTIHPATTTGNDAIQFDAAARTLTVNGTAYPVAAGTTTINGGGGADTVTVQGAALDRIDVELWKDHGTITGPDYILTFEPPQAGQVQQYKLRATGSAADSAVLHGTSGNNTFTGSPSQSTMTGDGVDFSVQGFGSVTAIGEGFTGLAEKAYLTGSTGDDTMDAKPGAVKLTAGGSATPFLDVQGFPIMVASGGGGTDTATFSGQSGQVDTFIGNKDMVGKGTLSSSMKGTWVTTVGGATVTSYYGNEADGFATVQATADANDIKDVASLYDSTGADEFDAVDSTGKLLNTTLGYRIQTTGYSAVNVYSTDAGSVVDRATVQLSPAAGAGATGNFRAWPDRADFRVAASGKTYTYTIFHFESVDATSQWNGGYGSGVARFFDSNQNGTEEAVHFYSDIRPNAVNGKMTVQRPNGIEYTVSAQGYPAVIATATHGNDTADMQGLDAGAGINAFSSAGPNPDPLHPFQAKLSPATKSFIGTPPQLVITPSTFGSYAIGFFTVVAHGNGGPDDFAKLYDSNSPTGDTFISHPDLGYSSMSALGLYSDTVQGFTGVYPISAFGNDTAKFYGIAGVADTFTGYGGGRGLAKPAVMSAGSSKNLVYYATAQGFQNVEAHANPTDANDTATLYDSALDDLLSSPTSDSVSESAVPGQAVDYSFLAQAFHTVTAKNTITGDQDQKDSTNLNNFIAAGHDLVLQGW